MKQILIFKDLSALHAYCADLIIAQIKSKPNSHLGFATGASPIATYELLIADHKQNHTSWKDVVTFNLDEFVGIDPNHPAAFIKQMKTNLFDHLDLAEKNIHIPNCAAFDPNQEAAQYEKLVQAYKIDLQYASLGINGHVAYNEPGTDQYSFTHVAQLTDATRVDLVNKKQFTNLATCPTHAITMGIQTLLTSTQKLLMVAFGAHKAKMVQAMLEQAPNSLVPATYLQLHPNCVYVLDHEAAQFLSAEVKANATWVD